MSTNKDVSVKPGDQFHVVHSGLTISRPNANEVARRGSQYTVTGQLLEDSKDRNGDSWLDLLHDDDGQIDRWGKVMFRPGPAPADMEGFEPNSPEAHEAREAARKLAYSIADPQKRAEALAAVYEKFGRKPTSRTLQHVRGDAERWEAERAEAEASR